MNTVKSDLILSLNEPYSLLHLIYDIISETDHSLTVFLIIWVHRISRKIQYNHKKLPWGSTCETLERLQECFSLCKFLKTLFYFSQEDSSEWPSGQNDKRLTRCSDCSKTAAIKNHSYSHDFRFHHLVCFYRWTLSTDSSRIHAEAAHNQSPALFCIIHGSMRSFLANAAHCSSATLHSCIQNVAAFNKLFVF